MSKMDEAAPPPYPHNPEFQNPPPVGLAPPGQYPYPPNPSVVTAQPTQIITVTTGPTILGYNSQRMTCPYCQYDMATTVQYDVGAMAHIIALVLCLVGCWVGCCCIPYCVDGCKDATHMCSNCHRNVGIAKRLR